MIPKVRRVIVGAAICGFLLGCGDSPSSRDSSTSQDVAVSLYQAVGMDDGGVVTWDSYLEPILTVIRGEDRARIDVPPSLVSMGASSDGRTLAVVSEDVEGIAQTLLFDATGRLLEQGPGPAQAGLTGDVGSVAVGGSGFVLAYTWTSPMDSSQNQVQLRWPTGVEETIDMRAVAANGASLFVDRLFIAGDYLIMGIAVEGDCVAAIVPINGPYVAQCVVHANDLPGAARASAQVVGYCADLLVVGTQASDDAGQRVQLTAFRTGENVVQSTDLGVARGRSPVLSCDGRVVSLDSSSPRGYSVSTVDLRLHETE